jgi:myo-inositol 2-dehydrogenase/D-chiro-inositol 1-dehydrogenase
MGLRIGIIGVGIMGSDHARIFVNDVPGVEITAIFDADPVRARAVAEVVGARDVADSPEALIADKAVDAVLIASPDATHTPLTLACLVARKPVLCEKPLAPGSKDCLEVIAAETKLGSRLVQVGFMRRYDPAYVAMKAAVRSGALGRALILHCVHRNVSAPPWFTSDMAIANSAPHEFDIARFVLGSDMQQITVFQPEAADPQALVKPVFMVLRAATGQLVDVEMNNNASYGYDVKCELVCSAGTMGMRAPASAETNQAFTGSIPYPEDWRPRFAEAYRLQNQAWAQAIAKGTFAWDAASAWDGYAATRIAEAGLAALASGERVKIEMGTRPALYDA